MLDIAQKLDTRWMENMAFAGTIIIDRPFSKKEFVALAERYPDMQLERENNGKITIMSPVKIGSGRRESIVMGYLFSWWLKGKLGETFSSQTGIELPDGAIKSPDCAWVSPERYAQISAEEEETEFLLVVPDFVAEVRSRSDSTNKLRKKMQDTWMKHGVRLGWLIDPYKEKAYIYRAGKEVEIVQGFADKKLTGEDVMPGMELPLAEMMVRKK